jgi:hypothetical protein
VQDPLGKTQPVVAVQFAGRFEIVLEHV